MTLSDSDNPLDREPHGTSDLARLWRSEFGHPVEIALRVLAVSSAGIGLWVYDGMWVGPVWATAFLAALAASYVLLRPGDPARPVAWGVGVGSYVVATGIFVSGPLYILAMDDPVLQFCGSMAVVVLCAYNLYRDEAPSVVQPFDIAVGWLAIGVVGAANIPSQSSLAAQAVMVLLCVVAGGYYTLALMTSRSVRADLRVTTHQQIEACEARAVGQMAGGIAHDFNNTLTALQGSLELYHEVPQGPERDALVEEARDAARRAQVVVARLLAFARRAPLDPGPVDASAVLASVARTAAAQMRPGIQFDTREPGERLCAMADEAALTEALNALIQNALEAVDVTGSIVLAADLSRGPATEASSAPATELIGAHVRFSVADDGLGLTPEQVRRAVEPFYSTKPKGSAAGLGLPMAKGFAEQSGGALSIRTSEDGTIVSLHLPIAHGGVTQGPV